MHLSLRNQTAFLLVLVIALSTLQDSSHAITYPSATKIASKDAPFFVSVWSLLPGSTQVDEKNGFKCGGILYSKSIVLTAAHCLVDDNGDPIDGDLVFMTGGAWPGITEGQIMDHYRAIIHPRFSPKTGQNDIAVVYLYYDSSYGSSKPLDITNSFKPKKTWLYGQGKNQLKKLSDGLRRVQQSDYSNLGSDFYEDFNPKSMIAAGYLNKKEKNFAGGCQGDSGGPLVVEDRGKVRLLGLVSGGASDCDSKIPTLYTRLHFYKTFINDSIVELEESQTEDGVTRVDLRTISLSKQERALRKYLPYQEIQDYKYLPFKEVKDGVLGYGTLVELSRATKDPGRNADISRVRFFAEGSDYKSWYLDVFFSAVLTCESFKDVHLRVTVATGGGSELYGFDLENFSKCPDISEGAPWVEIDKSEEGFGASPGMIENFLNNSCNYPKYKALDAALMGVEFDKPIDKAKWIGGFRMLLDPRCSIPRWSVAFRITYQNGISGGWLDTEPGQGMTIGPFKVSKD